MGMERRGESSTAIQQVEIVPGPGLTPEVPLCPQPGVARQSNTSVRLVKAQRQIWPGKAAEAGGGIEARRLIPRKVVEDAAASAAALLSVGTPDAGGRHGCTGGGHRSGGATVIMAVTAGSWRRLPGDGGCLMSHMCRCVRRTSTTQFTGEHHTRAMPMSGPLAIHLSASPNTAGSLHRLPQSSPC